MDSFRAQVARCTPWDCWDHSRASCIVMKRAFLRVKNLTNWRSVWAGSSSRLPRARRAAMYSVKWSCNDFIAHLPAQAKGERPRSANSYRSWHKSRCCCERGGEELPKCPSDWPPVGACGWPGCAGRDGQRTESQDAQLQSAWKRSPRSDPYRRIEKPVVRIER